MRTENMSGRPLETPYLLFTDCYSPRVKCEYYDAGQCRSCTALPVPYPQQLDEASSRVGDITADVIDISAWKPPVPSPQTGFRNKAKLAVGGRRGAPTLGVLDQSGHGVDLTGCSLYEPDLSDALPHLRDFLRDHEFTPYNLTEKTGELKNLIVTCSPDGQLMIRFVMRSIAQRTKLERALTDLQDRLPATRVVSVNLHPEHKATLEGAVEYTLTSEDTLPMRMGPVTLHVLPRSFFQTSTAMAHQLYDAAAQHVADHLQHAPPTDRPIRVLDLYCGVGGFALFTAAHLTRHLPTKRAHITGIERERNAVWSAKLSAREAFGEHVFNDDPPLHMDFTAADADHSTATPDVTIVNPPRRGLDLPLTKQLSSHGPGLLIYSSCNVATLAQDIRRLGNYTVTSAQIFDMFPNTTHKETLVTLRRAN